MKTVFLTDKPKDSSELVEFITEAFNEAKEFRHSSGAEASIRSVKNYYSVSRGLVHFLPPCDFSKEPQAVKDAAGVGDCQKGLLIHIDNISNMIEAWMAVINDALLRLEKPFSVEPTVTPGTSSEINEELVTDTVTESVLDQMVPVSRGNEQVMALMISNLLVDRDGGYDFVRGVRDEVIDIIDDHRREVGAETANAIEREMFDQFQESNYDQQIRELYRSFARDDWAVFKAPQHVFDYRDELFNGGVEEVVGKFLFFETLNIENYYAAPNTTIHNPGSYEFDVSNMTFAELTDAKTCDGFIESAIDEVIELFENCDADWLADDWDHNKPLESKRFSFDSIPVLKGRIRVTGKMLHKHGLAKDNSGVKDECINYDMTFWMINNHIVYASISLNRKAVSLYKVGGWQRFGDHVYQSKGVTTIGLPYQHNIDKSYRHMIKNQEFSALGVWGYNKRKIDLDDFKPEMLVGGIALPVKSHGTDGGNDRPIFNVKVDSNVNEMLSSISHHQREMEEKAQIAAFSVGISSRLGSNIRTTGLGQQFQNQADKLTLSKITELEMTLLRQTFRDLARIIIWTSSNRQITTGAIDVIVESLTGSIRDGDEASNIDMFIQNIVGMLKVIADFENANVDMSGVRKLVEDYAEKRGFSASDVFGEQKQLENIVASGNTNQDVAGSNVLPDGRANPEINSLELS